MEIDRKKFLRLAGFSVGALAGGGLDGWAAGEPDSGDPAPGEAGAGCRWVMVIDSRKCREETGCDLCIAACSRTHNIPLVPEARHEVKWIWKERFRDAFVSDRSEFANAKFRDLPTVVLCNHCDRPPCVRVCPTGATWKRPDGIVAMDWHRCIGCRYCMAACPYGSRSFNFVDPRPHIPRLSAEFPTRTKGVVEKCTFCAERLAAGKSPACVEACQAKAMIFGNILDPTSEVRAALDAGFTLRRKAELGTGPEVYYIV
jgi:molybdopterin-containing oxidoreductase family iron-sulfur binding subunit